MLTAKKTVLVLLVSLVGALGFSQSATAAVLSDGVWQQTSTPGTTIIDLVTTSGVAPGDTFVFTFPNESAVDSAGTDINVTGQTAPGRTNLLAVQSIVVTMDTALAPGSPITFVMTDALTAHDPTVFAIQSVRIVHADNVNVVKDFGIALITNYNQTFVSANVPAIDTDSDGIPDYLELGDRDGDGVTDSLDYDPTGYFYHEADGEILSGGLLQVSGPGAITMVQDASDGYYEWFTDGTPGIYTVTITSPPGYEPSVTCLPEASAIDPTGGPVAGIFLGNDRFAATDFLGSSACTTFYTSFDVTAGDPFIYLNNYPFRLIGSAGGGGGLSDTGQTLVLPIIVGAGLLIAVRISNGLKEKQLPKK